MKRGRKSVGFATTAVHGGEDGRFEFNPASTPIYQTSTFFLGDTERPQRSGVDNYVYTRIGNPTVRAFEEKMALLEEGESAVAFSSGMAATSAVLLQVLGPGDEVISSSHIYAGSRLFLDNTLKKFGCTVKYFDPLDDLRKTVRGLVNRNTKAIFFETPSNPGLSIIDLGLISSLSRENGLVSVVDNTFATPYLQKPLLSGIDCVVHSATKYIGGHGDSIGGVVIGRSELIAGIRQNMLLNLGGCISPFNAWLFLRGLKTLHVRMDYHCRSAAVIAEFLQGHRKVRQVLFPGLKEHPGHDIAAAQMKGFGGMLSFRLSGRAACRRFLGGLELCRIGVSLGDAETIALNSALMFHQGISDSACRKLGVDPSLVRISTGLESVSDVVEDIRRALEKV